MTVIIIYNSKDEYPWRVLNGDEVKQFLSLNNALAYIRRIVQSLEENT